MIRITRPAQASEDLQTEVGTHRLDLVDQVLQVHGTPPFAKSNAGTMVYNLNTANLPLRLVFAP